MSGMKAETALQMFETSKGKNGNDMEQLYANKIRQHRLNKLYEGHKLSKLIQEQLDNPIIPISTK